MYMLSLSSDLGFAVREPESDYDSGATFLPRPLLDMRFPADVEAEERARVMHEGLLFLASASARVELEIGEGLRRLTREFRVEHLGATNLEDACRGAYGFSWVVGRKLRLLAERLPNLPRLREAFLSGRVPRSKVCEVAVGATPDTDAAWAHVATEASVRELREAVKLWRAAGKAPALEPDAAGPEPDELVRIRWTTTQGNAMKWLFFGRAMLREVVGRNASDGDLLEALLQELESEPGMPAGDFPSELDEPPDSRPARRRAARRKPLSPQAIERLARQIVQQARGPEQARGSDPFSPRIATATCAGEADHALRQLVTVSRRLQWERSRLLRIVRSQSLHVHLGHPRWDQYLEHALGMSEVQADELCQMEGRLSRLPRLRQAFRDGTFSLATLKRLRAVARPSTEADWIAHALKATDKRLSVEVPWHVMLATTLSPPQYRSFTDGGRPLPDLRVAEMLADWRRAFPGSDPFSGSEEKGSDPFSAVSFRAVEQTPTGEGRTRAQWILDQLMAHVALDEPWHRRYRDVTVWARPEVAAHFDDMLRRVRMVRGSHADVGACVEFMLEAFAASWLRHDTEPKRREQRVLDRDGRTCTIPGCRRRHGLEAHHARFRSQGGSDEESNLVAACTPCHHHGVHEGHVEIRGTAPDRLTCVLGHGPWRRAYRNEVEVPVDGH
jgi:hypothetical protein